MKRHQLHVLGSIPGVPYAWALTIRTNPFRPTNHGYPFRHSNSSSRWEAMRGHLASAGLDRRTQDASAP
jgi:hypothetical protein